MFWDNMAEVWNYAYAVEPGHLDTPGMLTDEYGATVELQPARETGENPVLVVLHHKIQTVYLDVKPAPHGAKQDLISTDKA